MRTQTKEVQAALTAAKCLEILKAGNARFQNNLKANRNLLEQVNITASGQYPFATILSCIDSRTSAELIFDQGLGDVFSIRIAGNVLNEDILGSMEFACKVAGSKLLVVLGHSACGAVKGACEGAKLGHLTGLLEKIQPAVSEIKRASPPPAEKLVDAVAKKNVELVVNEIRSKSSVLDTMIKDRQLGIVGGMYSIESGEVEFMPLVFGT